MQVVNKLSDDFKRPYNLFPELSSIFLCIRVEDNQTADQLKSFFLFGVVKKMEREVQMKMKDPLL